MMQQHFRGEKVINGTAGTVLDDGWNKTVQKNNFKKHI